jgi:hypothetical protein
MQDTVGSASDLTRVGDPAPSQHTTRSMVPSFARERSCRAMSGGRRGRGGRGGWGGVVEVEARAWRKPLQWEKNSL